MNRDWVYINWSAFEELGRVIEITSDKNPMVVYKILYRRDKTGLLFRDKKSNTNFRDNSGDDNTWYLHSPCISRKTPINPENQTIKFYSHDEFIAEFFVELL